MNSLSSLHLIINSPRLFTSTLLLTPPKIPLITPAYFRPQASVTRAPQISPSHRLKPTVSSLTQPTSPSRWSTLNRRPTCPSIPVPWPGPDLAALPHPLWFLNASLFSSFSFRLSPTVLKIILAASVFLPLSIYVLLDPSPQLGSLLTHVPLLSTKSFFSHVSIPLLFLSSLLLVPLIHSARGCPSPGLITYRLFKEDVQGHRTLFSLPRHKQPAELASGFLADHIAGFPSVPL